jgi:hypothetical protein
LNLLRHPTVFFEAPRADSGLECACRLLCYDPQHLRLLVDIARVKNIARRFAFDPAPSEIAQGDALIRVNSVPDRVFSILGRSDSKSVMHASSLALKQGTRVATPKRTTELFAWHIEHV